MATRRFARSGAIVAMVLGLVIGAVFVSGSPLVPSSPAASASVAFTVYRTCTTPGGCGLWLQQAPDPSASHLGLMSDGDTFNVDCWQSGPTVINDPVWLYGSWNGTFGWAADYYITTHWRTTQDLTNQGIEPCSRYFARSPTAVTTAAQTAVTIEGTVLCASGRAVMGIWVASSAGGSGFARWTAEASTNVAQYSYSVPAGGTISLHVGCGGPNVRHWASDNDTPAVGSGSGTMVFNTICQDGTSTGQAIRCAFPTLGTTEHWGNPGDGGNCTWLAADLMYQAIGAYPGWGGNALVWGANAAATHWTVTSVPMVDSIFVFQPGHGTASSDGHVGWVTSVSQDGRSFTADEMNVNGLFSVVHNRVETYDQTTRFILIPPAAAVG